MPESTWPTQSAWPCGDLCDPRYQAATGLRVDQAVGTRLNGNKPAEPRGWILLGVGVGAAAGFLGLVAAICGDRQEMATAVVERREREFQKRGGPE
jgi:hypothetical protein